MTEITAENINKLITNDVTQFMKQVMKKKQRSEKQKENDAKLKDRLKLYHEQKRQAKLKNIEATYDNSKEIESDTRNEIKEAEDIALKHINDTLETLQTPEIVENVEIVKTKRGRPKKLHPTTETI